MTGVQTCALPIFGGPAGQIGVIHRLVVDERGWVSESRFLHALSYCMMLPGPEAQQLATYLGWRLHGVRGGLIAGTLFVVPGFVSILALSVLYAEFRNLGLVAGLFFLLHADFVDRAHQILGHLHQTSQAEQIVVTMLYHVRRRNARGRRGDVYPT